MLWPDACAHVVGSALVAFGGIDALVNNAGIGQASVRPDGRRNPIRFWETTAEQWGQFVAVNAAAPINMARAVVPLMLGLPLYLLSRKTDDTLTPS